MKPTEANQKKINQTKSLLKDIINKPLNLKYEENIIVALKSQNGLAKLDIQEKGIIPCSLNTFKNAAESILDGGFLEIDTLRLAAKSTIENQFKKRKNGNKTLSDFKTKSEELEKKLILYKKCNFLLSIIITELREDLKRMSISEKDREFKENEYNRINKKVEIELNYSLKEINKN